ncbi:RagB/SusD family nutrient uptake outer membrane protein [Tenacibaculum sp. SDUM215027]|uniref:RagB/SusD family nutrient uptake outer membrane protein n=1 Tax=Tenacibaculum sp. SDUM215027 TaxID=3422596 RepID=UPI003D312EF6
MKKTYIFVGLVLSLTFFSCGTDDLDPTLDQQKEASEAIKNVDNLYALVKGAYNRLTLSTYYGRDYIILNEVRTDNTFPNGSSGRFITQGGFSYASNSGHFWNAAYASISSANLIISTDLSSLTGDMDRGKDIQGQAYALRALAHFDLLKQYGQAHVTGGTTPGGIPYITKYTSSETNPGVEDLLPNRNTIQEVKDKIYDDLETAYNMMVPSSDSHFFSKYAARALEARVAVYFEDWDRAVTAAEDVINNGGYSIIPKDNFVGSYETDNTQNMILSLAFSSTDNRDSDGLGYIYRGNSYGDIEVLDNVATIFEPTDVRGLFDGEKGILGYEGSKLRNLGKFPDLNGSDDIPLLRYEELILNYAEALLESPTGGASDALTELNKIPAERGATPYAAATKENILLERRKELMFEGFRFEDLMRTGSDIEKIDANQAFSATIPYGDSRLALPIPLSQINSNSNIKQNKGY